MRAYWITFTDGTSVCCEGQSEYDAGKIAEHVTGKTVKDLKYQDNEFVRGLPYPCNPRVWAFEHPIHGHHPTFCMHGDKCAGRGSCPRERACDD